MSFGRVAAADGRVWIDPDEVRGLGTSGAGDVLAGVVGGLAARCGDAAQAACWAAVRTGWPRSAVPIGRPVGYLARELADEVAAALAELTGGPLSKQPGSGRGFQVATPGMARAMTRRHHQRSWPRQAGAPRSIPIKVSRPTRTTPPDRP